MKPCSVIIILLLLLPAALKAQDTLPRPSIFDEGYFFIGPGDVLKFKAYVQSDVYLPGSTSPGVSQFVMRRARFAATGFLRENFRYMLYARYDRGKVSLNEAFLEARHLSFARLRIGQYKLPFSLSNLKSSSQIDFVNRSFIIENFSPNYDIGAMVFGEGVAKHFDYALGVFNGTGPNKADNNNGKNIIGRLVVAAFASLKGTVLEHLYAGGSFSSGKQKADFANTPYTIVAETPVFRFNDSIRQNGTTTVYGYDLEWLIKSFSLTGEYLHYRAGNLAKNVTPMQLAAEGYYVAATYVLTGEDKKRNDNVKPRKAFAPQKGGWGAFELTARYEKTNLSANVLSAGLAKGTGGLHATTFGLNWYVSDDVKLVLNYQNYDFNQPVVVEGKSYRESPYFLMRVQFQF